MSPDVALLWDLSERLRVHPNYDGNAV